MCIKKPSRSASEQPISPHNYVNKAKKKHNSQITKHRKQKQSQQFSYSHIGSMHANFASCTNTHTEVHSVRPNVCVCVFSYTIVSHIIVFLSALCLLLQQFCFLLFISLSCLSDCLSCKFIRCVVDFRLFYNCLFYLNQCEDGASVCWLVWEWKHIRNV